MAKKSKIATQRATPRDRGALRRAARRAQGDHPLASEHRRATAGGPKRAGPPAPRRQRGSAAQPRRGRRAAPRISAQVWVVTCAGAAARPCGATARRAESQLVMAKKAARARRPARVETTSAEKESAHRPGHQRGGLQRHRHLASVHLRARENPFTPSHRAHRPPAASSCHRDQKCARHGTTALPEGSAVTSWRRATDRAFTVIVCSCCAAEPGLSVLRGTS